MTEKNADLAAFVAVGLGSGKHRHRGSPVREVYEA
jgi:hypothetical protein